MFFAIVIEDRISIRRSLGFLNFPSRAASIFPSMRVLGIFCNCRLEISLSGFCQSNADFWVASMNFNIYLNLKEGDTAEHIHTINKSITFLYIWFRLLFCGYQSCLNPSVRKQKGEPPYNNKYLFNERRKNEFSSWNSFASQDFQITVISNSLQSSLHS